MRNHRAVDCHEFARCEILPHAGAFWTMYFHRRASSAATFCGCRTNGIRSRAATQRAALNIDGGQSNALP